MLEKKGTKQKKGFLTLNTITLTQNNIIPQNIISNNNYSLNEETFIDYLRGGTQLNVILAVDFTGSNLNPDNPNSLHYMANKDKLN